MHNRATSTSVIIISLLFFLTAEYQVLGKDTEQLSEDQVLALLPRSEDMLDYIDHSNYQKLVSLGSSAHEALGQELIRSKHSLIARRIIAIFDQSKGDKTIALKYLKQFLDVSKTTDSWQKVRIEAANAIRKFEASHSGQGQAPKASPLPTPTPATPPVQATPKPSPQESPASGSNLWVIIAAAVSAAVLLLFWFRRKSA